MQSSGPQRRRLRVGDRTSAVGGSTLGPAEQRGCRRRRSADRESGRPRIRRRTRFSPDAGSPSEVQNPGDA
jgi:hypothetical protein